MTDEKTFDTFRELEPFDIRQLMQNDPSCGNGMVRIQKYRVTVEKVEEPLEVLHARLRKLWDECSNHHHREPLLRMGRKHGIDLHKKA
jgi:hypothetical protein